MSSDTSSFPINKLIFKEYFKEQGLTYKSFDALGNDLLKSNDDLRMNRVVPNGREVRRYLENGNIPIKSAVLLCQFFNCMPEELGIDIH